MEAPGQPTPQSGPTPIPQSWHEYSNEAGGWSPVPHADENSHLPQQQQDVHASQFTIGTWNVDYCAPLPTARIGAIFSRLVDQTPSSDIIFLQEVCKPMASFLLSDQRVRDGWYSSENDTTNWGGHLFATMTLVSKAHFGHLGKAIGGILGSVSRIKFRSRYGRDALCSNVFLQSPNVANPTYRRVQLVNVHLDSLANIPSYRPQQMSIVSTLLHDAGHGLMAGDFNPVLPEDQTLIPENKMVDAWEKVRGAEPGYTWGVDGKAPFPPNRMDRVAMVGLEPLHIEVVHPDTIVLPGTEGPGSKEDGEETVPWSDHSGLKCTFMLPKE